MLLACLQQLKDLKRNLAAAERKLIFFLAWANEQAPEVYEMLALAAAAEHHKHASALSGKGPPAGSRSTAQAALASGGANSERSSAGATGSILTEQTLQKGDRQLIEEMA
jgi:hypothetical protein